LRSLRVQAGEVRRIGLGIGLIATVLLPLALLFFEVLRLDQTISAILLFSGLWAFVFGLVMERKHERLYYSGSGVVVALLSTFLFIQFRYTAGLVIVAFVVLALVSALFRPRAPRSPQKA
jgi:4-amino-4-deoxy-L-arabinose transferase-like glycosyltransferase